MLSVSPNPATAGQAVTLTATVTKSGTDNLQPGTSLIPGQVTFLDGITTLGKANVKPMAGSTTAGIAQFTTSALGVGAHALTAHYGGETSIVPPFPSAGASDSPAVAEVVNAPVPPVPTNVTSLVSVRVRKGLPGSQQLVTVTNTTGQPIAGPLYLVFVKLPKRARLKGGSGATHSQAPLGRPFLVDAVTLLPGGYANFEVSFSGHQAVHFATEVFAGSGTI
jgi:hypothetical protein